ncbi:MAG: hypothetical protein AAGC97_08050 [Planctomycetota bacterium]
MRLDVMGSALAILLVTAQNAPAAFTISFDSRDFGIASVFNHVTRFDFEIIVDDVLQPGRTYTNPVIDRVNYRIDGVLPDPTPSMFGGFQLVRSISGAEFYTLSPDATVSFSVAGTADLGDGLQFNELSGTGVIFEFNAREFNQSPGRYHPPVLTLRADGTGRLVNADNQSTFPNPPPPIGSGLIVNVAVADEYDVNLSFSSGLTIAAVPEPTAWFAIACVSACGISFHRPVTARVQCDSDR